MLKRVIKSGTRIPLRMVRSYRARSALLRLTNHDAPVLRSIGEALNETATNLLTIEEQRWISSIEERRSTLLQSDQEISVVDFGAGSSDAHRTREQMDQGVTSSASVASVCRASKPPFWATLLFKLIRKLRPDSCFELGTCVGISAAYQAAALKLNGTGSLVTLEGSPEVARIARETLDLLGLGSATVVVGPFHETMNAALKSAAPVDFIFNDGHHDRDAVLQYFDDSISHLSDRAVMVIDDISWSKGMQSAWSEIVDDERVSVAIDLEHVGIAVTERHFVSKQKLRIPLHHLTR